MTRLPTSNKRSIKLYSVVAILLISALTASIGQVAFKKGMGLVGQIHLTFSAEWVIRMIKVEQLYPEFFTIFIESFHLDPRYLFG